MRLVVAAVALLAPRAAACDHGWTSKCQLYGQSCSSAAQVQNATQGASAGQVSLELCELGLRCDAGSCTSAVSETMDDILDDLRSHYGSACTSDANCGQILHCLPSTKHSASKSEKRCRWQQASGVADITACQYSEECQGQCGKEGLCVADPPPADVGAPCAVDEQCKKDLYCLNGAICAAPLPSGSLQGNSSDSQRQCPSGQLCVVFQSENDPGGCHCTTLRTLQRDTKFRVPHDPTETLRSLVCASLASFASQDAGWHSCVPADTMKQEGEACQGTPPQRLECLCAADGDSVLAVAASAAVDRFVPPPEEALKDAVPWYLDAALTCGALHVSTGLDLRFEACMAQRLGGFDNYCPLRQRPRQGPNSKSPVYSNLGVPSCGADSLWRQLGHPSTHQAETDACEHRSALCEFKTSAGVKMCARTGSKGGSSSGAGEEKKSLWDDAQWVVYSVLASTVIVGAIAYKRGGGQRNGDQSPQDSYARF